MESNLRLCVMLVVLFGHVLAEDDVIQAADTNLLSPARRAVVEERCQKIRRDCIATGEIFRRSVVCGGGGKRFINECALHLRSCDLLLDTGEEILQERCFWVVQEEEPEEGPRTAPPSTTVDYQSLPPLVTLIPSSPRIIVDYFFPPTIEAQESTLATTRRPSTVGLISDFFPWFSTSEVRESTLVTSRSPSTTDGFPYHWDSSPVQQTTQGTTRNPSTEVTTTEQTTNFLIDHGGTRFSSTPVHHSSWMPEAQESTLATTRRPSTVGLISDFFPWFSTSEVRESTLVTSRSPSTTDGFPYHWDSSPVQQTTQGTTRNPSTEVTTTEQTTNFLFDHGGIRFPSTSTPLHHSSWMPESTTGESGGFKPPGEVNVRDCCSGDTPCASCLREDKGGKVCGSDGKTYDNECALDNRACDTGKEGLRVLSKGSCPPAGRGDNPNPLPPHHL